jgi:drug/metabolite transporter (DMT)-like permease
MKKRLERQTAILELSFAGALWGFGFIAAIWALRELGPLAITGLRFAIAATVGLLICFAIPKLREDLSWRQFRLALVPGLLITATLIVQTYGLRYTTATKSGFLTTLYVLMVPFLENMWLKRRLPRFHLAFVVVALIGVALICDIPGALLGYTINTDPALAQRQAWNIGDLLTLVCAGLASLHIVWFALIRHQIGSSFVFNNFQSVWAALPALVLAGAIESWPSSLSGEPLMGLLMLTFGSTLIAFALQVRAQKVISPSLASVLFLLESPFAALFAYALLGESLRSHQWLGAGLILAAVALSSVFAIEAESESPQDG